MKEFNFSIIPQNDVGHLVNQDDSPISNKSDDLDYIRISFDFSSEDPMLNLTVARYSEYTGGCFGFFSYSPEVGGLFKRIYDSFLDKDPEYKEFFDGFKLDIQTTKTPMTLKNARTILKDYLDSVFSVVGLTREGREEFSDYCTKNQFEYSLPNSDTPQFSAMG